MEARDPQGWWPLFQRAMRAGDAGAVIAGAAGQNWSGHAGVREQTGPQVEARADFEVTVKKIVQAGDLALLHSEVRLTRPQVRSEYALEILRLQPDGRWLLALGYPFTIG